MLLDLTVRNDPPSFGSSCLPETMRLAVNFKPYLLELMGNLTPATWALDDRVLVWLVPNLEQETKAFYSGRGGPLKVLFAEHVLESIDRDLASELLRRLDGRAS